MSVNTADIINSTCATCLSRGRKFSIINDEIIELLFCLKIKLCRNDKLCWECKAMIKKLIYFTNKAHRAQTSLTQLLGTTQFYIPDSLSDLKTTLITTISYKTLSEEKPLEQLYVQMGDKTQEYEVLKAEPTSPSQIEKDFEYGNIDFEKDELKSSLLDDATSFEKLVPEEPMLIRNNLNGNDFEHVNVKQSFFENDSEKNKSFLREFDQQTEPKLIENNFNIDIEDLINNAVVDKKSGKDGDIYLYKKMDDNKMFQLRENKRQSKKFQSSKYKCERCIEMFRNKPMLNVHYGKHSQHGDTRALSCRVCEQRFASLYELQCHLPTHYDCYMCRWCTFECDQIDDITRHYEFLHELNIAECDGCKAEFQTVKDFREHKKKCRKTHKPCKFCGRKFAVANMYRHLLVHTGMPLLECDICHKKYRGKWGLKAHMRTHSDLRNESAYCTECDIQFSNVYIYKTHLKNSLKHVAVEDLKHKCLQCDKRFATLAYLKEHTDARHTDSPNYTCEICSEPFKTKKGLRRHIRVKHEGRPQPRNKVCSFCGKAFINKACLQQHMNTHTGARPYVCQECGDTFGFSGALYMHRKLKHKLQKKNKDSKKTEKTVA